MAVEEHPTTWFEDIAQKVGNLEPVALECVLAELKALASGHGRKSRLARVAIEIAEGFEHAPCGKAAPDQEIMSAALTLNAAVATTDRDLASSLVDRHVRVFSLRSGRVAVLE